MSAIYCLFTFYPSSTWRLKLGYVYISLFHFYFLNTCRIQINKIKFNKIFVLRNLHWIWMPSTHSVGLQSLGGCPSALDEVYRPQPWRLGKESLKTWRPARGSSAKEPPSTDLQLKENMMELQLPMQLPEMNPCLKLTTNTKPYNYKAIQKTVFHSFEYLFTSTRSYHIYIIAL